MVTMHRYFILLFIFVSPASYANKLAGEWVQDIDKQLEFNNMHSIMNAHELDVGKCGNQSIWFDDVTMVVSQDKIECHIRRTKGLAWPFTVTINSSLDSTDRPSVHFHIENLEILHNFICSMERAYEAVRKEEKDA